MQDIYTDIFLNAVNNSVILRAMRRQKKLDFCECECLE
jgi:hypothetical protein